MVDAVLNLESLTRHLFLWSLAHGVGADPAAGTDGLLAATFLALLFNASYMVRLLTVALAHAFDPEHAQDRGLAALFAGSAHWALDEQAALLCSELMSAPSIAEGLGGKVAPGSGGTAAGETNGQSFDASAIIPGDPGPATWEAELARLARAV